MTLRAQLTGAAACAAISLAGCGSSANGTTSTVAATMHASTRAASALPAPSSADRSTLENAALRIINGCLNVSVGGITGAAAKADVARSELESTVASLIAISRTTNLDAPIPINPSNPTTLRKIAEGAIAQLNEAPPAPAGAPACDPELARKLSQAIGAG